MGDDDNLSEVRVSAMRKLLEMKDKINTDDSGYYTNQKPLDEMLREKHPALKDAFNQYQILLKFAKAEYYSMQENQQ